MWSRWGVCVCGLFGRGCGHIRVAVALLRVGVVKLGVSMVLLGLVWPHWNIGRKVVCVGM